MEPMDIRVPDRVGETRKAWRAWKISIENGELVLRSINQKEGGQDQQPFRWLPKEVMIGKHVESSNQKRKDDHGDNEVPYEDCSCGIHALDSPLLLAKVGYVSFIGPERSRYVWGELEMWGKIIDGSTGVKAQYAYPQKFYIRPDLELQVENESGTHTLDVWIIRDILQQQWGVPVQVVRTAQRVSMDSNEVRITEYPEPTE